MSTASEVAIKAAAYIREHGHVRNELRAFDGGACFNGAILITLFSGDLPKEQFKLWDALDPEANRDLFNLISDTAGVILDFDPVEWNNRDDRTGEEVADLLDQVAAKL